MRRRKVRHAMRARIPTLTRILSAALVVWGMGCGQEDTPTLHVFTWSDYFTPEVLATFEAESGAKVVLDTYESNEDLVAKLQAGVTGYDVVVPSDYAVEQLAGLGLLATLTKANVPNLASNVDGQFLGKYFDPGNTYSVPYVWGTAGIGYDSSKLATAPTSWAVLWDESLSGEINMLGDSRETFGVALKRLGYSINESDPARIAEAQAMLIAQKPLVYSYETETDALMQSKQVTVTHAWNGDVLRVAKEQPEWKYVVPDEGGTIFIDNLAIPKATQHQALAESFLDYLLRPDVIAQITLFTQYANCVPASQAHLPEAVTTNPAVYPPSELTARLEPIKREAAMDRAYGDAWTALKAAQ
jgi:spermidine/putrescine transport system substrate-binding protein